MEKIVQQLEKIINEHGKEYLKRSPYEVYSELIAKDIAPKHARLVLITLLSGTSEKALELDVESLSKNIQKECYLRKNAADEVASMYHLLFRTSNIEKWKKRKDYGFREFYDRSWEIKWSGFGMWNSEGGYINCWCDIAAEIEVADKELAKEAVANLLEENPFTTADEIFDFFFQRMSDALETDLQDYITGDDYYPPVMEDYSINGKYALNECCKKLGLKVLTFDCDGRESDFEADY